MGTLADDARATARELQQQELAQLRRELKQTREQRDAAQRQVGQLLRAAVPDHAADPDALDQALHWIQRMHHISGFILRFAELTGWKRPS